MPVQKGREFLLKIGDGEVSEAFTALAGVTSSNLAIGNTSIDVTIPDGTTPGNVLVQEMLSGKRAFTASGSGRFVPGAPATELYTAANLAAGPLWNFQIVVPGLGSFTGNFHIDNLQFAGEMEGEATFEIALSSSGAITFAAV